jgi:hypothetical protein
MGVKSNYMRHEPLVFEIDPFGGYAREAREDV